MHTSGLIDLWSDRRLYIPKMVPVRYRLRSRASIKKTIWFVILFLLFIGGYSFINIKE